MHIGLFTPEWFNKLIRFKCLDQEVYILKTIITRLLIHCIHELKKITHEIVAKIMLQVLSVKWFHQLSTLEFYPHSLLCLSSINKHSSNTKIVLLKFIYLFR